MPTLDLDCLNSLINQTIQNKLFLTTISQPCNKNLISFFKNLKTIIFKTACDKLVSSCKYHFSDLSTKNQNLSIGPYNN
jgi:hypothetical protein